MKCGPFAFYLAIFLFGLFDVSASPQQSPWQIAGGNLSLYDRLDGSGELKNSSIGAIQKDAGLQVKMADGWFMQASPKQSFEVSVAKGESVRLELTRKTLHPNGSVTWVAHSKGTDSVYRSVITQGKHSSFARIETETKIYVLSAVGNSGVILPEQKLGKLVDVGKTDYFLPKGILTPQGSSNHLLNEQADESPLYPVGVSSADEHANEHRHEFSHDKVTRPSALPALTDESKVTLDVLFVYSEGAEQLYMGDVQTRIYHLIAVTNQIYLDSGVHIEMAAAGFEKTNFSDNETNNTALGAITANEGVFSGIENKRFEAGADLVVFFRPYANDGTCGVAWQNRSNLPGFNGLIVGSERTMYSVTNIDCSDYTNAHEVGHNLGLGHSEKQGETGATFHFARGYGVDAKFATVMAYEEVFNAPKVMVFSNPRLTCGDLPCGIERTDLQSGADAAYALNFVRHHAARIYKKNQSLQLVSDALQGVQSTALRNCLEDEIATNAVKYAGQLQSLRGCEWGNQGSDYVIDSLTGIEAFSNIKVLWLFYHAISDITPLHQLDGLSWLYLPGNPIVDSTPLKNLSNLQLLALTDVDEIINFDFVSQLSKLQYLELGNSHLQNLNWIGDLPFLNELRLYQSSVNELSPLLSSSLSRLIVSGNKSIAHYSVLKDMKQLTLLHLSYALNTEDISSLSWISGLTLLNDLRLDWNNVISDLGPLASLTELEKLSLMGNDVRSVMPLFELNKLQSLDLTYNAQLDCAELKRLWKNNTSLEILHTEHCVTNDDVPPVFLVLPDLDFEGIEFPLQVSLPDVYAQDATDGQIKAVADNIGPFYPGEHIINWIARDFMGNISSAQQRVRVSMPDPNSPKVTVPESITVEAENSEGTSIQNQLIQNFLAAASARNSEGEHLAVTNNAPDVFPLGQTSVRFEAVDSSSRVGKAFSTVTVVDTTAPKLLIPEALMLESKSNRGVHSSAQEVQNWVALASATDIVDPDVTVTVQLPDWLPLGQTEIEFSAVDKQGNSTRLNSSIFVERKAQQRKSKLLLLLLATEQQ